MSGDRCEFDGCNEPRRVGFRRCTAHLKPFTAAEFDESHSRMVTELGWTADTSGYPSAPVQALKLDPQPIQIVSAHVTVNGRSYSVEDIAPHDVRPGDIFTWTAHDGRLGLSVERVKPWWRRWPWARTERQRLGEIAIGETGDRQ
ncbi:MAG TPA: hypothetical protein VIQ30_23775 [Pseudonocardia sp.]